MKKVRIDIEGQQGRKDLVNAIGEIMGIAPVYAGAGGNVIEGERFRFSYVVMNITIAQDCAVIWDERTDAETLNKVFDGLEEAGYEFERPAPETAEAGTHGCDEPDACENGTDAPPSFMEDLGVTGEAETGSGALPPECKGIMDTLVEERSANERENGGTFAGTAPAADEDLAATVTDDHGGEYDADGNYIQGTGEAVCFPEDGMSADDVPTMITIELPAENVKEDVLRPLIESKAALIKAALGDDGFGGLPVVFDYGERKVQFNWLRFGADADAIKAWSTFLAAACKFSKTARRVTAKDTAAENEKFAFRTFMVKIGMSGPEDKWARKFLLRNLTGDSAFATPESKAKWQAKHGKKAGNTEGSDNDWVFHENGPRARRKRSALPRETVQYYALPVHIQKNA